MSPLWQITEVNTLDPLTPRGGDADAVSFWPQPTRADALARRRRRLCERLQGPSVIAAGYARARNFPHNPYPFRAESHFLYLVGRQLEGAALVLEPSGARLYLPPDDPGARLWHGAEPTASDWSRELGLEVRSIGELNALPGAATVPPQDPTAAAWLSSRLGRPVTAGSG